MPGRQVAELFAGVGGFRLGFEAAGWKVTWSNQWEPSTKTQHASECYVEHFGSDGHVNEDISLVLDHTRAREIPDFDLLCGGFPCQDYSVAKTLNQAWGIEGKKGVLWWEIVRLLEMRLPRYVVLENVDRLLKSPASQRGRDFAIILSCLCRLGYLVEWRVVNAADYGFPQKRRRAFIVAERLSSTPSDFDGASWLSKEGVLASALPCAIERVVGDAVTLLPGTSEDFAITQDLIDLSDSFGRGMRRSVFANAGVALDGRVWTRHVQPLYEGERRVLGDVLQLESEVPNEFYVDASELEQWRYLKGGKRVQRTKPDGFVYYYSEGAIPFPDPINRPARTILTGEGGRTPSRFKHLIKTESGRFRRLTPTELERLNGFPDDWTSTGMPDGRRAFMMGNALVVGVVKAIALALAERTEVETLPIAADEASLSAVR